MPGVQHPIFTILKDDSRKLTWLAKKTSYSYQHIREIASNMYPTTARFREECTAAMREAYPDYDFNEGDLFVPTEDEAWKRDRVPKRRSASEEQSNGNTDEGGTNPGPEAAVDRTGGVAGTLSLAGAGRPRF